MTSASQGANEEPGPVPRYPLSLRLNGRLAVVVGGGAVAAGQAAVLGAAGATVLVVAEQLSPPLADQAGRGLIAARTGRYRAADLNGAWLVLACADDPAVNAEVAADAEQRRLWCLSPADLAAPGDTLAPHGLARDAPAPRAPAHDALAPAVPAGGRRVLVLGGARSGKSVTAETFLGGDGLAGYPVEYVATGTPPDQEDAEWAARIAAHQARRPARWRTTETIDLEAVLASGDQDPVLIDCLSLWLARVMDECGAWDDDGDDGAAPAGAAAVADRVDRLVAAWRATARLVVAVSNEVGCGVVPATSSGRRYRDALGRLNAQVAVVSDEVWFCTAGLPRRLR
jgi:adenosylcobinamide kinase/adenosylcobinamide-phosphate guanylyltransferase